MVKRNLAQIKKATASKNPFLAQKPQPIKKVSPIQTLIELRKRHPGQINEARLGTMVGLHGITKEHWDQIFKKRNKK